MRQRILNSQESVVKLGLHSRFSVAFQMLEESFEQRIKIKYVLTVQLLNWSACNRVFLGFFPPHLSHLSSTFYFTL